jgi:hypothetical protein
MPLLQPAAYELVRFSRFPITSPITVFGTLQQLQRAYHEANFTIIVLPKNYRRDLIAKGRAINYLLKLESLLTSDRICLIIRIFMSTNLKSNLTEIQIISMFVSLVYYIKPSHFCPG